MRVFVLALSLLLTNGCDTAATSRPTPSAHSVAYQLLTHCGVYYTRFENEWYYADPPNPRGRWTNPIDQGTMTPIDKNTIVFSDPAGNRAVFTKHPPYPTPTIQGCD